MNTETQKQLAQERYKKALDYFENVKNPLNFDDFKRDFWTWVKILDQVYGELFDLPTTLQLHRNQIQKAFDRLEEGLTRVWSAAVARRMMGEALRKISRASRVQRPLSTLQELWKESLPFPKKSALSPSRIF